MEISQKVEKFPSFGCWVNVVIWWSLWSNFLGKILYQKKHTCVFFKYKIDNQKNNKRSSKKRSTRKINKRSSKKRSTKGCKKINRRYNTYVVYGTGFRPILARKDVVDEIVCNKKKQGFTVKTSAINRELSKKWVYY